MSKQKQVVAIRHVAFEDLGAFAEPLDAAGYSVRYLEPGDLVAAAQAARDTDLLVVLGGPIGVYEDSEYPFLAAEIAIITERLALMRPVLGICLGAQLMARALGAQVFSGPSGKEIGWHPIELTDDGRSGPLRHLAGVHVLHWHGDTFSLPPSATRLASTSKYANQAFSVGRHALGFQFHPEADGAGFERWLVGHACEIATAGVATPSRLRDDAARYGRFAGQAGKLCLRDWLAGLDEPRGSDPL